MMYEHLRKLYDQELWSNLCHLGSLTLCMAANHHNSANKDAPAVISAAPSTSAAASSSSSTAAQSQSPQVLLTPRQRLNSMVMLAEAYCHCKEYRRSEALYKEALQVKKHLGKVKSSSKESEDKLTSEVEIKYKLHLNYLAIQQPSQAINILQSVPAKQRTPKSNMALGKLYQKAGMERPAVTCFREVLKACPMSLDAAQSLMHLGVKARDIQELTLEATTGSPCLEEWFNSWIQAQACFASRDYPTATASLKQLEEKSLLRREINVLVTLGQSQYYQGDYISAFNTLTRVNKLDPNNLAGMDILAAIMCRERKTRELEAFATKLIHVSEEAPEPWIAMGYYCYLNKKGSRAVYFAHKACLVDQRNVEALLLKGNVLLHLKKLQDAINHFREAMIIAPCRYELHKGLIDCYLALARNREAAALAATACKQLNNSPRALTLLASVLLKDPYQMSLPRAKSLLEKALRTDPCYLPAVYMLADIMETEGARDKAIELLQRQLNINSTCKLHQMLADMLVKGNEEEKAMEHYTLALNLDPKNTHAQEGLHKIEQNSDGPLEATYDLEMDEDINSDEGELEESETEAVWSDGDLNLAASNTTSRYL